MLDVATERLGRAWGTVGHLNAVADTPELRAAYNEDLPKVTEFWTRLGADERLYAKYKAIDAAPTLDARAAPGARERAARLRAVGGAELHGRGQGALRRRSRNGRPSCAQKFSEHVLDATDAFALLRRREDELAGVPARRRAGRARRRRRPTASDGFKLTLHCPATCR